MRATNSCLLAVLAASVLGAAAQGQRPVETVRAKHAMVVTIHHDATDAGIEVLKEGGNAVDAAVAVGFALAVVYPQAGNIGGGGFMLIRDRHGKAHFIDYREKAPAAASAGMYLDAKGNVIPGMSTIGQRASGVPGTVAGLAYAERVYGRLDLARVMTPAIKLAEDGYVLTDAEAQSLHSRNLAMFPESRRIYQRGGDFYEGGEVFKQPGLAATLRRIATNPDEFYRGRMAQQIADFEVRNGGLITAGDLAAYQVKERQPLKSRYRGYDIITSPPPSSGGIVLIESLNILSGFDLTSLGPDRSAAQVSIIAEAFRRAYMDRGDYLGDPDFTTMPLQQMADPAYAAAWRRTITPGKATPSADLVRPTGYMPSAPGTVAPHESLQTTHFSVVDRDGMAVSNTYTLNFSFGSGVTVEGLGFLLNDEMDDFTSKMGVPNGYGLVQGPANAIAPGKRPLSSMTPTIVATPSHWFRAGRLRLVLGSPGGSTIMTTVANDLISILDNGLDVQQSADAPRFHHQYLPDQLDVEKKFPVDVASQLKAMGYTVRRSGEFDEHNPGVWGDSELIAVDPKTGELEAGHDSRRGYGKAAGYYRAIRTGFGVLKGFSAPFRDQFLLLTN